MKATGIVRRIDDLGRVVIPKEIRRTLRIREGDPLEIFVDREGEVILKNTPPSVSWEILPKNTLIHCLRQLGMWHSLQIGMQLWLFQVLRKNNGSTSRLRRLLKKLWTLAGPWW